MEMTDSQRIPAPRQRVWEGLNDPELLKAAIPGCESVEKVSDTEYKAKVTLKIGPVKASFNGVVTLSDLDPPSGYTIAGEGQGGVAGFAKGSARVRLEEDGPDATLLHYEAQAQVGGKIAQLGARLIDGTAKMIAGSFFSRFGELLTAPPAGDEAAAAAPDADGGESSGKETAGKKGKGWLGRLTGKA